MPPKQRAQWSALMRATSVRGPRALCVVHAHAWEAGCRQEAESGKWEEESRKHDFIISCPVPSAGAHMYARYQASGPTGMPGPKRQGPTGMPGPKRRGPQVCPVDVA